MALDVTAGGPASESYASVAEADAYHSSHPRATAWEDASPTLKEWALKQTARLLDTGVQWLGAAATDTQALQWPRNGVLSKTGYALPANVVPAELKNAQSEFARQLLEGDRTADNEPLRQGIKSIKAGSVSLDFKDAKWDEAVTDFYAVNVSIPDAVLALLPKSWYATSEIYFDPLKSI